MSDTSEVWVFTDIANGDSGKGTTVDCVAFDRGAHTTVRFNGGAQAGHGVTTPDGRHHIFAQFGCATMLPGVETFLSRFMLLDPWRMVSEEGFLRRLGVMDAFERTSVDERCLVVTPFHGAANRLRERSRGEGRHGSCGLGVGEAAKDALTQADVLWAADLRDLATCHRKLLASQHRMREQLWADGILRVCWNMPEAQEDIDLLTDGSVTDRFVAMLGEFRVTIVGDGHMASVLARPGGVIFEPAQGVLLDEWRGFHPHTTWSTTTDHNANALLREAGYAGRVRRLGIVRGYAVRHGAGPFPTYDTQLSAQLPDPPSARAQWQGAFRVGAFDTVATRYAIACLEKPLDGLVITCLDRLAQIGQWKMATSYEVIGRDIALGPYRDLGYQEALTHRLLEARPVYESYQDEEEHLLAIERELDLPVALTSHGPSRSDKHWRG